MRAVGVNKFLSLYVLMGTLALGLILASGRTTSLWPETPSEASQFALLGLLCGLVVVLLTRIMTSRFAWAQNLAGEFRSMIGELNGRQVAVLAIASGLAEELFFRGLLQPALGLTITSLAFGFLHVGPNRRFIPWTIMAVLAGFGMGALFIYTGSIVAPACAHITINWLNLRFLASSESSPSLTLAPLRSPRSF